MDENETRDYENKKKCVIYMKTKYVILQSVS